MKLALAAADGPFNRRAAPSTDEALCGTADVLIHTSSVVDPLYLSSCRVLLLGFCHARCVFEPVKHCRTDAVLANSAAPHRDLQEMLWKGGGICVDDAGVATHVVVAAGADRRWDLTFAWQGASHVASCSLLQDTPLPPGCKVVSEQWLRSCKITSQLLPVDRYLLSSSARAGEAQTRTLQAKYTGTDRAVPLQAL